MGLDFVVLERDGDDPWQNSPYSQLDARLADDPAPIVRKKLHAIYDAEFRREPAPPAPELEIREGFSLAIISNGFKFLLVCLLMSPILLVDKLLQFVRPSPVNQSEAPEEAQEEPPPLPADPPTFEDWRTTLINQDPPPVILSFGPDCPPEAKPLFCAAVQEFGFRGRLLEPDRNALVDWWGRTTKVDMITLLYGDVFQPGPQSAESFADLRMRSATVGDMAAVCAQMAADCAAAFPELAAAADAAPLEPAEFGPYPDRGLKRVAWAVELTAIRDAARFFKFWEGRGFPIAPDY